MAIICMCNMYKLQPKDVAFKLRIRIDLQVSAVPDILIESYIWCSAYMIYKCLLFQIF